MVMNPRKLAQRSINIKDPQLLARVNSEVQRSGTRLKTTALAATMIDEALAARGVPPAETPAAPSPAGESRKGRGGRRQSAG